METETNLQTFQMQSQTDRYTCTQCMQIKIDGHVIHQMSTTDRELLVFL